MRWPRNSSRLFSGRDPSVAQGPMRPFGLGGGYACRLRHGKYNQPVPFGTGTGYAMRPIFPCQGVFEGGLGGCNSKAVGPTALLRGA